jgi:fibronectin-binding autotransporter adhesin
MRGRFCLRLSYMVVATCAAMASPMADAQTAVWTGAGPDQDYTTPANWSGGVVPTDTGTFTVNLSATAPSQVVDVNTAADVAGIVLLGVSGPNYQLTGTGSLTLGSGGISPQSSTNSVLYVMVPVTLSIGQTWNGSSNGFLFSGAAIGESGGPQALAIDGRVYLNAANTFTGGLTVLSTGTVFAGSGQAAGLGGTLTLDDNATFQSWSQPISVPNPVTLGNGVNLGSDDLRDSLTLTGPITTVSATTDLLIGSGAIVTLTGTLGGPPSTVLTFTGANAEQPSDGGSRLVFQGALNQVAGLTISGTQMILAPTGAPAAALASLSPSGLQVTNSGYLGLDGTFATPGAASTFIATYGAALGSTISGSIGFDTIEAGPANTFSDPIGLGSFSTDSAFLGLASATKATLSGAITPTSDNAYIFGGGGGTLTITSNLDDFGGTRLQMTAAPEPLTLILQGANDYTGSVFSGGGVLIFDSSVLPAAGRIILNGGYVGSTETPALSSAAYIGLFSNLGNGVIGFDQHTPNPALPRQIGDILDLSVFNSDSNIFIGTSTAAELTNLASLTPANNNYQFTGVKGGVLTVDTPLTDGEFPNSVTIGLLDPIESGGSISVVRLTGDNTYSGGTTFNSGALFVNSNTALGASSGVINVPDLASTLTAPNLASYGGSPVSIANPISVGSMDGHTLQGLTLGNASPVGNDMLVLNGVISDENADNIGLIAITGPVTLGGANTYSGGTILTGIGNAMALVTNPLSFGTGAVTVQAAAAIIPQAGVTLQNPIALVGNSTLTLGKDANSFVLALNGAISGNGALDIDSSVVLSGANSYSGATLIDNANVVVGSGGSFGAGGVSLTNSSLSYGAANPTILDLNGSDANSSVTLAGGQTLTLDADEGGGNFMGAVLGNGTNEVIKVDSGIEYLGGNSTYAGGTDVVAGTLIAGSSNALGMGNVSVEAGAQLGVDSGVVLSNPVTLAGGATLSGRGTFNPPGGVTLSGGTAVSPGLAISSEYISTLSFGSNLTFGTGGIYSVNVANAGGTRGIDYSTISVTGTLNITAAPDSFTIAINSITPGGGPGPANFNPMQPYSWTILTAGSIPSFNSADFMINAGNFQNPLGGGSFALGQSGNMITLDFTPIPEPSTWVLMLTGLAAGGAGLWRRKSR